MTRKDYELIATIISGASAAPHMPREWSAGCNSARDVIARQLADEFVKKHVLFSRQRFLATCGVSE